MAERPEPIPPEEQERAALQAALDHGLTAADAGKLWGTTVEQINQKAENLARSRDPEHGETTREAVHEVLKAIRPDRYL